MNAKESVAISPAEQEVPQAPSLSPEQVTLFREMIAAGVASGRKKSSSNPKMDEYVFTYSRSTAILDVEQTVALLDAAAAFLKKLVTEKQTVLVLGSQPAARDFVKSFAEKHGFYYIVNRWLGGTLTNFKTISKRIGDLKQLKDDKASGALDKYTKKERVGFDRTINNLEFSFSGMEGMSGLPAALFVVDAGAHDIAVREARRMNIPIIAVMNNDSDPRGIAYPVPANDNSRSSLAWVFARFDEKLA